MKYSRNYQRSGREEFPVEAGADPTSSPLTIPPLSVLLLVFYRTLLDNLEAPPRVSLENRNAWCVLGSKGPETLWVYVSTVRQADTDWHRSGTQKKRPSLPLEEVWEFNGREAEVPLQVMQFPPENHVANYCSLQISDYAKYADSYANNSIHHPPPLVSHKLSGNERLEIYGRKTDWDWARWKSLLQIIDALFVGNREGIHHLLFAQGRNPLWEKATGLITIEGRRRPSICSSRYL